MGENKLLFDKGFLKGDKDNSALSLKGMMKLADIFKAKYNFINIAFLNENEFSQEFSQFYIICERFLSNNENICEKIKNITISDSDEEDLLFIQMKNFNKKYKNINEDILNMVISNNIDLFLKLLFLHENQLKIINDLMCKKILNQKKTSKINYYIWSDATDHFSLVTNIETYYIFLDSCSTFFARWPGKLIISNNNNNKLVFQFHKTLVMKSFLQYDGYNCGSFVFSFINSISELYQNFNSEIEVLKYLLRYFNSFSSEEGFITETKLITKNNEYSLDMNLYLLPKEFLKLCQSTWNLEDLKRIITKKNPNSENIKIIEEIINNSEIEDEISRIRNYHLELLKNVL